MNNYSFTSRFLNRGISYVTAAVLVAGLTVTANSQAMVIAESSFTTNDEGWTGLVCPNPGDCALQSASLMVEHLAAGGNPGGYIRTRDPSSSTASRLVPSTAFSSRYAMGQTLSFDVLVERNTGNGLFDAGIAPLVTIEGGGKTLVYPVFAAQGEFPLIDEDDGIENDDWKHYDVLLSPSTSWLITSGKLVDAVPLGPGDFATVFGNSMTRLSIISEWLKDTPDADTGGLDNVTLTDPSVVPVPAALPLLFSALAGLGFGAKRRS